MGVTVHFEGTARDENSYVRIMGLALEFAKFHNWTFSAIDETHTTLRRIRDEEDWDYEGPTRGITLQPHENCESLRLEFDKDNYIQEYCKTQFSPTSTHVLVVELLKNIEPEFGEFLVEDEGEYWETGDQECLEEHLSTCFKMMDELLESDPICMGPIRSADGRIIDLVKRDLPAA